MWHDVDSSIFNPLILRSTHLQQLNLQRQPDGNSIYKIPIHKFEPRVVTSAQIVHIILRQAQLIDRESCGNSVIICPARIFLA